MGSWQCGRQSASVEEHRAQDAHDGLRDTCTHSSPQLQCRQLVHLAASILPGKLATQPITHNGFFAQLACQFSDSSRRSYDPPAPPWGTGSVSVSPQSA
jgi:hypothetical protein